jgi:hypothetical protein
MLALPVALLSLLLLRAAGGPAAAQTVPTDTPAVVDLSGVAPQSFGPTETPTRTPTPPGPVQLEALNFANVRALPDTASDLLGEIRQGEFYNVLRRYQRWIEFQYDPAPTRRGWVFDELVRFIGDESAIPIVDDPAATAEGGPDLLATNLAITATPGGLLTATAQARTDAASGDTPAAGELAVTGEAVGAPDALTEESLPGAALPTYTFPPGILALAPTEAPPQPDTPTLAPAAPGLAEGGLPPVAPILALGVLSLLGFLLSSLRR